MTAHLMSHPLDTGVEPRPTANSKMTERRPL
jgi:hypothetical protein